METIRSVYFNDIESNNIDPFLKSINRSLILNTIMKFAKDNSKSFKDKLSGNGKKSFDKEMSGKEINPDFVKNYIFNYLDKDLEKELYLKIVKKLFSGNDEIYDCFEKEKPISNLSIVEFINHSGTNKNLIESFLSFCKFDYELSKDEQKKINESSKIDALKTENKKLKDTFEKLKQEFEKSITKIKDLETKLATLKKERDNFQSKYDELKDHVDELKKLQATNTSDSEIKNDFLTEIQDESDENIIKTFADPEVVCEHLERKTFLGSVKAEDIDLEQGCVLISPLVPIIGENSNINKSKLSEFVDTYKNDYSAYILYINSDENHEKFFTDDEWYDYEYYTETEKHDILESKLCNKVLSFRLTLKKPLKGGKRKLIASLVDEPKVIKNFTNSLFIPFIDMSKSKFEKTICDHDELVLSNYSNVLNLSLKYVCVEESIYEINYVPNGNDIGGQTKWKYKADADENEKKPFKLLKDIGNLTSEDFVETKNINCSKYGIYIRNVFLFQNENNTTSVYNEQEFIKKVISNASAKNLYYSENDIKNFHIAVKSSKLVILAGPSGIGKSKLPLIYANTLGLSEAKKNVLFVPISPSYVEPEDILGYIKPLTVDTDAEENCEFIESQTGLVSFLKRASENKDRIYFVVFDEMNLSQIEHWFAPFLSILEQDNDSRSLKLYSDNLKAKNGKIYHSSVEIGDNVFFIGTVNIDDTTKKLSDRLLDRSILVDLNPPSFENLREMTKEDIKTNLEEVTFSKFDSSIAKVENPAFEFNTEELNLLNQIKNLITKSFGRNSISFRGLKKIALYLKNSDSLFDRGIAFDNALAEIVFSKLTGTSEEFEILTNEFSEDSIYSCFNTFSNISNFDFCKRILDTKLDEIKKYGFTR